MSRKRLLFSLYLIQTFITFRKACGTPGIDREAPPRRATGASYRAYISKFSAWPSSLRQLPHHVTVSTRPSVPVRPSRYGTRAGSLG